MAVALRQDRSCAEEHGCSFVARSCSELRATKLSPVPLEFPVHKQRREQTAGEVRAKDADLSSRKRATQT